MGVLGALDRVIRGGMYAAGLRGRTLDTSVGPVHYYEAKGRGPLPTLVLQHGIGAANATHFAPIAMLARRWFRRVIVPELPGHGRSATPAEISPESVFAGFHEVLDRTLDEPAIVYGNSLGGAMAIQFAQLRPERTRALILASPGGAPLAEEAWRSFVAGFDMDDRARTLDFFQRLHHRVPMGSRWVLGDVRRMFHQPHMRALLASIRPDHFFAPEAVAGLRAPTLLLWGRSDRVMFPEMLEFYRTHLPAGTRVEEPEGIGHCPQIERPFWTLRRILEFSREHA